MPKTLRVILIWTLSLIAFIVSVLFVAQRYLGPEVKKLFVSEINKSLTAKVEVQDVQLSLIKEFPFAAVRFYNVKIKEALPVPSKDYLMIAGTISLRFNIWDLLRKKYIIKSITFSNIETAPHVYADGSDNFHFWKKPDSNANNDFNFQLQRIVIHNLHVKYINDASVSSLDVHFPGFIVKGNLGSSKYALDLAGKIILHDFKTQGISYISEREIDVDLNLNADNDKGLYSLTKGLVETGKLKLSAIGKLLYIGSKKEINIGINASSTTLEEMVSLIPAKYMLNVEGYKFRGLGNVSFKVSGAFDADHLPAVDVSLDLKNGEITEKKSGVSLKNVSALAVYSMKQGGKNGMLSVNNLKAKLGDGFISGSLVMQGFTTSLIQCNLVTSMNLSELRQFLRYDELTSLSGSIKFNLAFNGTINDLKHPSSADFLKSTFTGNGSIQHANLGLKSYGLPLNDIQTEFVFGGNDLNLQHLTFKAGRSDFNLNATLGNLLPWMFVDGQTLSVSGALSSKRFDWDELSGAQQGNTGEYQFRLPKNLIITNLQLKSGSFTFGGFSATSLTGTAQMRDNILAVNGISMSTCQGMVTGQVNINAIAEKYAFLQAKAHLEKVNVKTLFTQFNNFGQDDLKDANLEGSITSDIIFAATMLSNLDIDLKSIKTHCDVMIENGRLVNYGPMQSLSKFMKLEDLADIRFQTLQNQIDISNEIIYIPTMDIKSSALDLQLMGTHTFGNEIDYHFVMALADVVATRFKKHNSGYDNQAEFGPVEDDGRGRTKIYVLLTGTVDNPLVKYDKRALREKLATDLKIQKAAFKQILKQEFKSDTLKTAQRQKEKDLLKKQEEGKFVIEWDEGEK